MKKTIATLLALCTGAVMFVLLLGSMKNDSATFDETAHIAAGFGYVTQLDYRLNPEHPPLIKALAALSGQLFTKPYFPTTVPSWQEYNQNRWWLQFDQGRAFLYESGNDADRIIFWTRIPILLVSLLLGWILFLWTQTHYGSRTALLALLLYAFSPTVLAHSRYVTTDIAASLGFFLGLIVFLRFLEKPAARTILLAGLTFGAAQLLKFSLIMLIPIYGILLIAWVYTRPNLQIRERFGLLGNLIVKTITLGVVGMVLVWVVYAPFVWNYPKERQLADAISQLSTNSARPLVAFDLALIQNRFTRPLGEYFLGVLMANQRAAGGNTAFFLGEVSSKGSRLYFPLLYIVKESLVFHILTIIALFASWRRWRASPPASKSSRARIRIWTYNHFPEFSMIALISFYWLISITSPLNIGIRHVLPTFPFIYILVARGCSIWLSETKRILITPIKYAVTSVLLLWLTIETAITYPHFLSYYNILAGGTDNGYIIATDSNYDWGQDFYRLTKFVRDNAIEHIAIDYFGGASPAYYLGDVYEPWWSAKGPPSGWFAISVNALQGARANIGPGFSRKPEDSYEWLNGHEPVARAGMSIFIYEF
ncbi:MAG: hypothetical protein G01um101429_909 [Parcubacteria group bacterium Gr01-1014_29]|nr:MAG: hypothetical protein G01um101429_909 [Parcubacteria group bacterium Gr01-1014_29]